MELEGKIVSSEAGRELAVKSPEVKAIIGYIQKKYMKPLTENKLLYHYTGINGFMGIMENRELWATNSKYLNDKMECRQGLKDSINVIEELWDGNHLRNSVYPILLWNKIQDILKYKNDSNIYSISFCQESDLLSQWRGYGRRGGVAIGFDFSGYQTEKEGQSVRAPFSFLDRGYYESVGRETREKDDFSAENGEVMINLHNVLYDVETHKEMLADLINIGYDHMKLDMSQNADRDLTELVQVISESIEYVLPIIKNNGFREGKEVRYIWRDDGSRKIYFREKKGMIVPYIRCMIRDCDCKELDRFPVKEIIVGPQANQREVMDSVKFFLQHSGYEYLVDQVRASEIPYYE